VKRVQEEVVRIPFRSIFVICVVRVAASVSGLSALGNLDVMLFGDGNHFFSFPVLATYAILQYLWQWAVIGVSLRGQYIIFFYLTALSNYRAVQTHLSEQMRRQVHLPEGNGALESKIEARPVIGKGELIRIG
jgi:hypothetical protein